MRLSELLDEVRADAPPPRYDVADVVRAGKRLRRRRRAGWVLAAGTAVTVVVAVPFVVARPETRIEQASPASSPSPTTARAPELDFALSAYSAGRLRVADPNRWTLAAETAVIDKKGSEADAQEGEITLYRRGVDPRSTLGDAKITPVEAIRGRPAYRVDADGSPMLLWEYADDSMALITSRADGPGRYALTPAEERQVAEAFRPGPRRPVRIAIGASYVPDGYRLVEATASSATFIPTPDAVVRLGKPDPGPNMPPIATITLHVGPASEVHGRPRDGVICPEGTGRMAYCFAFLGDSQVEEVRSRSAVDTVELGRMLKSGRFVPLSDPDHWMPLSQAFPASALIGGE